LLNKRVYHRETIPFTRKPLLVKCPLSIQPIMIVLVIKLRNWVNILVAYKGRRDKNALCCIRTK
jgi:hypothetical protein